MRNRSRGPGLDGLLNKSVYQTGESVRVRAMVRDERGDATKYAQVNCILRRAKPDPKKKEESQYPLNPVETRVGLYDVTIENPDKGDWVVELSASKDGKPLGKQELKFQVIAPPEEMYKLAANPDLLRKIATDTKGSFYELAQLPNLIDEMIRSDKISAKPTQETVAMSNTPRLLAAMFDSNPKWDPNYDLPIQAGLVFLILAIEWMLRRKWQLP